MERIVVIQPYVPPMVYVMLQIRVLVHLDTQVQYVIYRFVSTVVQARLDVSYALVMESVPLLMHVIVTQGIQEQIVK
jgi:hypothetical protein